MDAPRIGRLLRVLRVRRGWRQRDLADAAKVTRGRLMLVENGRARELSLGELCEIFEALDASVDVVVRWRGEGADRLLDDGHAALVEEVVRRLRAAGWTIVVEASYNVFGERGSIDILAWHPGRRILLVIEVKTFITDTQALLWSFDRKVRLAPTIARDRGWNALAVGRLLVAGEGRTNRRRIAEHGTVFASTFPTRGAAVGAWLRSPRPALRGDGPPASARRRAGHAAPRPPSSSDSGPGDPVGLSAWARSGAVAARRPVGLSVWARPGSVAARHTPSTTTVCRRPALRRGDRPRSRAWMVRPTPRAIAQ